MRVKGYVCSDKGEEMEREGSMNGMLEMMRNESDEGSTVMTTNAKTVVILRPGGDARR